MIAAASFSALGLVIIVAVWSKFAPSSAQRRSVKSHQHALDVLGEVAKRRDGQAAVHVPSPEEVGGAHVHTTDGSPPTFHLASREEIGARKPISPLVLRSGPTPLKLPIFGELSSDAEQRAIQFKDKLNEQATQGRVVFDDATIGADTSPSQLSDFRAEFVARSEEHVDSLAPLEIVAAEPRESAESAEDFNVGSSVVTDLRRAVTDRRLSLGDGRGARRAASVAAAIVALAAIGVGTWQVASNKSPNSPHVLRPPASTHARTSPSHNSGSHSTIHEITPVSQLGNVYTYPLTTASFTIKFSASAACWIGVRSSLNGQYLWMTTLGSGGSVTYRANGPVYVRIGAPQYLHVQVDGVQLTLPPRVVRPYDITFATGGSVSA